MKDVGIATRVYTCAYENARRMRVKDALRTYFSLAECGLGSKL